MKRIALVVSVIALIATGRPAAAIDMPNDNQITAITAMMLATFLQSGCRGWRVNEQALNLLMIRERITPKDIYPTGRYQLFMETATDWTYKKFQEIEPQNKCTFAEVSFGPNGYVEKNLMTKR